MNDFKIGDKVVIVKHPYIKEGTIVTINSLFDDHFVPKERFKSMYKVFFNQARELTELEKVL